MSSVVVVNVPTADLSEDTYLKQMKQIASFQPLLRNSYRLQDPQNVFTKIDHSHINSIFKCLQNYLCEQSTTASSRQSELLAGFKEIDGLVLALSKLTLLRQKRIEVTVTDHKKKEAMKGLKETLRRARKEICEIRSAIAVIIPELADLNNLIPISQRLPSMEDFMPKSFLNTEETIWPVSPETINKLT